MNYISVLKNLFYYNFVPTFYRFLSIISSSSYLLSNFKLRLRGDVPKRKIIEILGLERRLQVVEISGVFDSQCFEIVKIFKKFGSNFREIVIEDLKIDDFPLREILKHSSNVNKLTLREVTIVKNLPVINPVNMRSLKELTIVHSDWEIIEFIRAQVLSLHIQSYVNEGLNKNKLIRFIADQRNLRTISLLGTSSRTIFQQDEIVTNCNFKLLRLRLHNDFGKHSDNVNRNVLAFIKIHGDSLKNLQMSGPHCEHISSFAIANFNNLHSLALDARSLPNNEDLHKLMSETTNINLKSLKISGFFSHHEAIKKVLLKYPGIERLELHEWGDGESLPSILEIVSKNCIKLKELLIVEVPENINFKLPSLKHLQLKTIEHTVNLMNFLRLHPSINKLSVNVVTAGQEKLNFAEQLKQLEHLKQIKFGGTREVLKPIFDIMKNGEVPKSLEVLQFHVLSETPELNVGETMYFTFPIPPQQKFK